MFRLPNLTLTQSKAASVLSWAVVALFQALALFFPVRGLPLALRVLISCVLALTVLVIVYTTLSRRVEKPDERAAYNNYRANSAIYELFFFLFALFVLFGDKWGLEELTMTRSQLILLFAVLNLAHDGFFLLYERFGK